MYPKVLNHNLNFAPSSVLTELCWWLSFTAQVGTNYCGVNLPQDCATSREKTGTDHNSAWQDIPVHISQLPHIGRGITAGLRCPKSHHIIQNCLFQSDFFLNCCQCVKSVWLPDSQKCFFDTGNPDGAIRSVTAQSVIRNWPCSGIVWTSLIVPWMPGRRHFLSSVPGPAEMPTGKHPIWGKLWPWRANCHPKIPWLS